MVLYFASLHNLDRFYPSHIYLWENQRVYAQQEINQGSENLGSSTHTADVYFAGLKHVI